MENFNLECVKENDCSKCYEPYIFKLKNGEQEFHLGLKTILECLSFAEEEGAIPKISNDWWNEIESTYKFL